MAQPDYYKRSDDEATAGDTIQGIGGAIPFLNVIAPGLGQAFQGGADRDKRRMAINELRGAQGPRFSANGYEAASYSGDFNPEMYADPVAAQYQLISEDPRVRGLQMQALQRLQGYGDQAADSMESLGRYNAMSDGNALAAQREAGIRNQMQMRGQGGSGAEFAMQQIAAQEGANRAQSGGLNSAMQAALQRLQGTQAAFGAASGLRGQDFNANAANSGIINAFNMRNTDALNSARMANTNLKNAGQLRNLDARQGHLTGVAGANNANVTRGDHNAMASANFDWAKRMGISNAIQGAADGQQRNAQAAQGAGKQGNENFQSLMKGMMGGM